MKYEAVNILNIKNIETTLQIQYSLHQTMQLQVPQVLEDNNGTIHAPN